MENQFDRILNDSILHFVVPDSWAFTYQQTYHSIAEIIERLNALN